MTESASAVQSSDFLVVGLGGSAGSIPAFREFFRNVPSDSGMAFVVILHLSPEYESQLANVLQPSASIPIEQVHESVRVEPDHVYVIPPNKSLALQDGMLRVSDIAGFEERRAPIDIFFRSLANTHDSRAVCVVMSGSGADGSMGLRRIKEYEGLVLVQDPAEAEFDDMPRHAIATGLADLVLPVAGMPAAIKAYHDRLRARPLTAREPAGNADEQALIEVFTQLRVRTGHDFTNYKRATVLRRIERRLAVRSIATLADYALFLRDPTTGEADALLRELLISVTNFFRDKEVWERVEETVIPRLLRGKTGQDHVRIWVAGCATGEEAYSVAILLADAIADLPAAPDVQIFATDLDEDAIAKARNGYYSAADTADVPPERLRRHFVKDQDGYRIRRELREMVLFAHHNLIKDPPFSHLDFVTCRNVLIYLNRTAQERAMEVLHFALEPGGYLLLGTAESVDGSGQFFSTVDKEHHLFQSRAVARVVTMPSPAQLTVASDLRNPPSAGADHRHGPRGSRIAPADLHQRLLEEYAPPSLIVDEQYDIVHLTDRAGRYLEFGGGEASLNLLQVLRPELRIDARTALFQAAQKGATVSSRAAAVHTGERREIVNIVVRPVLSDTDPARGYFLVLFEDTQEGLGSQPEPASMEPAARQLEEELIRIKSQMRIAIEQYKAQAEEAKAANEELQAMNEELRSTAEELETSQEELQSVNEELQTVNQELKVKIDEISDANNDMLNLMSSTEIGTIFVDRSLRVKLFTPRIRDIFNLIPADIGRPLMDITNKLTAADLPGDVGRVLERLQTIEREIETHDGHWHLTRLLPYRTAEDRIDGVVVTFLDITERKHAEEALRRGHEQLEQTVADRTVALREISLMLQAVINASPLAIISVDRDQIVRTWNPAAEAMFGWSAEAIVGKPLPDTQDDLTRYARETLHAAFTGSEPPVHGSSRRRRDGTSIDVNILTAPLTDAGGEVYASMALIQDITERRALEREREQLLRRIVASQEEERQRIALELHDQLGQHLTALKVGLEALQPASDAVEQLKRLVSRLDESVDRLTLELRPPALDDVGLDGAITSLIEQFTAASGIRADVHVTGADGGRLPEAVEIALYRVAQEALTNVWKHSGAKNVSVILECHPDQLQLIVEDDGQGFDENTSDGAMARFGLVGMRERTALVGGTFHIESGPRQGTTLYVRVPLQRNASTP